MATIAENIQTLRSIKSDIKNAIIQKGGSVTDAFGTYAQAITNLPSGGGGGTEIEDALVQKTLSGTYYNNRISMVGHDAFSGYSALTSIDFSNCIEVSGYAFNHCTSLQSVSLPLCEYIGGAAFQYCSLLININLQNCTHLEDNVFYHCSALPSIDLPNCSFMAGGIFNYCTSLVTVKLPICNKIGGGAFANCINLKEVYLNSVTSVTSLTYNNVFSKCPNLTSVYVPASLVDAFKVAPNWSSISDKIVAYTEA